MINNQNKTILILSIFCAILFFLFGTSMFAIVAFTVYNYLQNPDDASFVVFIAFPALLFGTGSYALVGYLLYSAKKSQQSLLN